MATFEDVRAVSYSAASHEIREALGGDKIQEVKLAKELADRFRNQYNLAARQARTSSGRKTAASPKNSTPAP
jgi:hypothetical protein